MLFSAPFDNREEYRRDELSEATAPGDPFDLFRAWYADAERTGADEPNAMTLATVSATGAPSARIVLLRGLDSRGFCFFTNYESRKGGELAANPRAALVFFWREWQRQVRVTGIVERLTGQESDEYFATRPRGSQIGAWASQQSRAIESRAALDEVYTSIEQRYKDVEVPRPPYWGGYRLVPSEFEFWQGRPNRLHDRLQYSLQSGSWVRERLAP